MFTAARGPFYYQTPPSGPAGDPYWNDVSFLYYFDNNLTDQKGNFTLSLLGDTALSSTQSKFGGYSIYNGNSNTGANYASISGTSTPLLVGTGDYTFECWWYPLTPGFTVFNKGILQLNSTKIMAVSQSGGNYYLAIYDGTNFPLSSNYVTVNAWNHICWSRVSGTTYMGINGTLTQVSTLNFNVTSLSNARLFADEYPNESAWGYFDSARFTKGVARYTGSTYTVPTAEFPNS